MSIRNFSGNLTLKVKVQRGRTTHLSHDGSKDEMNRNLIYTRRALYLRSEIIRREDRCFVLLSLLYNVLCIYFLL